MRYMRLLAMLVLSVTTGLGSAEAATSGPPAGTAEADPRPGLLEASPMPAALGSPCFGSMAMAFSLDMFSMGRMGYAPVDPLDDDDSVLGLICRLTTFPIGRN
jgi:hypothetical protein